MSNKAKAGKRKRKRKNEEQESIVLEAPPLKLPLNVIQQLKPHQVEGIHFLWRHLCEKNGCILADSMGLGKTLQVIGVMCGAFECGQSILPTRKDVKNSAIGVKQTAALPSSCGC